MMDPGPGNSSRGGRGVTQAAAAMLSTASKASNPAHSSPRLRLDMEASSRTGGRGSRGGLPARPPGLHQASAAPAMLRAPCSGDVRTPLRDGKAAGAESLLRGVQLNRHVLLAKQHLVPGTEQRVDIARTPRYRAASRTGPLKVFNLPLRAIPAKHGLVRLPEWDLA